VIEKLNNAIVSIVVACRTSKIDEEWLGAGIICCPYIRLVLDFLQTLK
jgi:hypothetical protein